MANMDHGIMNHGRKRTVTFTISPDGQQVESDAQGFVGKDCADFTDQVKKALGASVIDEKKKPEFYKSGSSGVSVGSG